jgi:excisionase family DNA binding protein
MTRSVFLDEAAQLLGVSRRTVYYRIREGRLRTVRICGSQRVLVDSIEALLREEAGGVRAPGADVSGRDPSAKSPAL